MIDDIGAGVKDGWCLILNTIGHAITTVTAHMVLVDRMRPVAVHVITVVVLAYRSQKRLQVTDQIKWDFMLFLARTKLHGAVIWVFGVGVNDLLRCMAQTVRNVLV